MTKSALAITLAEKANIPVAVAERVVDEIFDSMIQAFRQGDSVYIRGFGSLMMRSYEPYVGRNPKTGVQVSVGHRRVPAFIVSEEMRQRVAARGTPAARIVHSGPGVPQESTGRTGEWSRDDLAEVLDPAAQLTDLQRKSR